MSDVVIADAKPVTIGTTADATFNVGHRAISGPVTLLDPRGGGFVLCLDVCLSGRLQVDGLERELSKLAAQGISEIAVGPGDWGVIELDDHGAHKIFFHFPGRPATLPRTIFGDHERVLPALAFAVVLHAALLAFVLTTGQSNSSVSAAKDGAYLHYLARRPAPPPTPVTRQAQVVDTEAVVEEVATAPDAKSANKSRAVASKSGRASTGKPTATKSPLDPRITSAIERVLGNRGIDRAIAGLDALGRQGRDRGASATGPTTRGGRDGGGDTPGVGGNDPVGSDPIDVNKGADKKKGTGIGNVTEHKLDGIVIPKDPTGDFGGLRKSDIAKVVRRRANRIRACYERQLQRRPGLGGRLVVRWTINPDGDVIGAKIASSDLRSLELSDCVLRVIKSLHFPAPKEGQVPRVRFPFVFRPE